MTHACAIRFVKVACLNFAHGLDIDLQGEDAGDKRICHLHLSLDLVHKPLKRYVLLRFHLHRVRTAFENPAPS